LSINTTILLSLDKNDKARCNQDALKSVPVPLRLCSFPKKDSNLVDPASSHTLVSKIKPCMSKYKQLYSETANGSLYQL
jgi:hypothetical protein